MPQEYQAAFRTWIGGSYDPLLDLYHKDSSIFRSWEFPKAEETTFLWRRLVLGRDDIRTLMEGTLPTWRPLESWSRKGENAEKAGIPPHLGNDKFDVVFRKRIAPEYRIMCCDSTGIGLAYEAEVICVGQPIEPTEIWKIRDKNGDGVPDEVFACHDKYGSATADLMFAMRNRKR